MRIYSLHTPRLIRQIIADVLSLGGIITAFVVAAGVKADIIAYRAFGGSMIQSGADASEVIQGFAEQVRQIPFVGPALGDTVDEAVALPDQLVTTGQQFQQAVSDFAGLAWAIIALVPLASILLAWLPWRALFAFRSLQVQRLSASEGGLDILAQRALLNAPPSVILRLHSRAAKAMHHDDRVRDSLAMLERRVFGFGPHSRVE